jgi:hypothetical protein
MVATETIPNSTRLEHTRRRVARWRETRPHRHAPMPAALWAAAVAAARRHGLDQTARTRRVDDGALKKHLDASAERAANRHTAANPSPLLVELTRARLTSPAACVIELATPHGTRRICLNDLPLPDLLALGQRAWGAHA